MNFLDLIALQRDLSDQPTQTPGLSLDLRGASEAEVSALMSIMERSLPTGPAASQPTPPPTSTPAAATEDDTDPLAPLYALIDPAMIDAFLPGMGGMALGMLQGLMGQSTGSPEGCDALARTLLGARDALDRTISGLYARAESLSREKLEPPASHLTDADLAVLGACPEYATVAEAFAGGPDILKALGLDMKALGLDMKLAPVSVTMEVPPTVTEVDAPGVVAWQTVVSYAEPEGNKRPARRKRVARGGNPDGEIHPSERAH
jgi:hypothetical protein